jgi:hypothetical protein
MKDAPREELGESARFRGYCQVRAPIKGDGCAAGLAFSSGSWVAMTYVRHLSANGHRFRAPYGRGDDEGWGTQLTRTRQAHTRMLMRKQYSVAKGCYCGRDS